MHEEQSGEGQRPEAWSAWPSPGGQSEPSDAPGQTGGAAQPGEHPSFTQPIGYPADDYRQQSPQPGQQSPQPGQHGAYPPPPPPGYGPPPPAAYGPPPPGPGYAQLAPGCYWGQRKVWVEGVGYRWRTVQVCQ